MRRFLLRFTGILTLIFGFLTGGSILAGRLLPPAPVAVFMPPGDDDLTVFLVDTRVKTVRTYRFGPSVYNYRLSPGCRLLLPLIMEDHLRLDYIDLKTGAKKTLIENYINGVATWLPDGRHAWIQYRSEANQPVYTLLDSFSDEPKLVPFAALAEEVYFEFQQVWSPDSRYGVLYNWYENPNEVYVLDTVTGSLTRRAAQDYEIFSWSPDSRYLARLNRTGTQLQVLDVETMAQHELSPGEIHIATAIGWTSDNDLLFFARPSLSESNFQLYRWSAQTQQLEKMPLSFPAYQMTLYFISSQQWSPDGTKIFHIDEYSTLHVRSTATGVELANMPSPPGEVTGSPFWSPDSRYLLSYNLSLEIPLITDTLSGQTTPVQTGLHPLESPVIDWKDTQPVIFDQTTGTLGHVVFTGGLPEFVADFTLPGADYGYGAFCDPEETAP